MPTRKLVNHISESWKNVRNLTKFEISTASESVRIYGHGLVFEAIQRYHYRTYLMMWYLNNTIKTYARICP